jgi:hypothetical protein
MAKINEFQKVQPSVYELSLTLASGATSASADIGGAKLIGVAYPSGMPNTSIAIQEYIQNVSGFLPVQDSNGTALSIAGIATGTAAYAYFNPADVASLDGRIQFTTASAAGGARVLTLKLRAL